jgi:phosphoglycerate dehydrogenase-like enzyme
MCSRQSLSLKLALSGDWQLKRRSQPMSSGPKVVIIRVCRQVMITPHVSAMSLPHQVAHNFVTNMELFIEDQPLRYPFNWDEGY